MSRVASLASHTILLSRMQQLQRNLHDMEEQVSTSKKSQDYSGISVTSLRLVTIENQRDMTTRLKQGNELATVRAKVMEGALDSSATTIRDMRNALRDFSLKTGNLSVKDVEDIRKKAFAGMRSLELSLNAGVDGSYVFGGGRTNTRPVDLGSYKTADEFGARYSIAGDAFDPSGEPRPFPTTADDHVTDPAYYYQGDQLTLSHRVDENATMQIGVKADDPAFEKAFRAMGMIAQDWGDAAEWSNFDADLVGDAIALLNSALEHDPAFFADKEAFEARPAQLRAAEQTFGLSGLAVTGLTNSSDPIRFTSVEDATTDPLNPVTLFSVTIGSGPTAATSTLTIAHNELPTARTMTVGGATITFNAAGHATPGIAFSDTQFTATPASVTTAETELDITNVTMTGLSSAQPVAFATTAVAGATRVTATINGVSNFVDIPDGAASATYTLPPINGAVIAFDAIGTGITVAGGGGTAAQTATGDGATIADTWEFDLSAGTFAAGDVFSVVVNGQTISTAPLGPAPTITDALTALETALNSANGGVLVGALGSVVVDAVTNKVTITAATLNPGDVAVTGGVDRLLGASINVGVTATPIAITAAATATITASSTRESTRDVPGLKYDLGMNQVMLDAAIKRQTSYSTFLQIKADEMENVDPVEAISKLQSASNALEVAYAVVARVRELSLVNYLR